MNIAIIGATGNIGRKMVEILLQHAVFAPQQVRLFASSRSVGKKLTFAQQEFLVENLIDCNFSQLAIALFATEKGISQQFIPKALAAGCIVVDSSSLHLLNNEVPLIVGPVTGHLFNPQQRLYAVANCLACPLATVLAPLQAYGSLKSVNAVTFQSVSGAGKQAMDELVAETSSKLNQTDYQVTQFARPIAFNVIPQVDKILDNGQTYEEYKIIHEVQKILGQPVPISVTAVRVPVLIGHSIALTVEFTVEPDLKQIISQLQQAKGIQLSANNYTTPCEVVEQDDVFVGRIRLDQANPKAIQLWLCSDNLRRGGALDAVEVAEILAKQL